MTHEIQEQFDQSMELHNKLNGLIPVIEHVSQRLISAYQNKGKMIIFGNGGSAADAQHIAAEMLGHYRLERNAWPAIALTTNTSALTAIGNDYGYENIFSRQVEAWVRPGDVVIGITTSGKSGNVVLGLKRALELGAITVGLCGNEMSFLRPHCTYIINVPSHDTPRIQEVHILIGHIICQQVEEALFASTTSSDRN